MSRRLLCAVALAALLSACATVPAPQALPPAQRAQAEARLDAREAALRPVSDWSMSGRVAVSVGRDGGSGRLEWRQRADGYTAELSAPITRQGWRLSAGPGGARLEGLEGGPRTGPDAGALLLETTGWYLPMSALADWARGLRAASAGPARVEFDAHGRLAMLQQDGWQIRYEWPDAASGGGVELPRRIDARHDGGVREARVKLMVDDWQGASGDAATGG